MSEPAADMTLPRCWPPRQHERGPCEQLRWLCKGLVCSDPKAADPIGPSLKQNVAAAAVAGRADAAALRVAHTVAAVRVVVARVSPPSWCLISCVLHALHAAGPVRLGLDVRPPRPVLDALVLRPCWCCNAYV